jgi:hypothetical protein
MAFLNILRDIHGFWSLADTRTKEICLSPSKRKSSMLLKQKLTSYFAEADGIGSESVMGLKFGSAAEVRLIR